MVSLLHVPAHAADLQALIDATPAGGALSVPAGRHTGHFVIRTPMILQGNGNATLDGGGRGTVLTIEAPGAAVRGLRIRGSGDSHDSADAGVLVMADRVRVEDNVLEDVLFGVHLRGANHAVVSANRIVGRPADLNLRGDGIRLWNSRGNRIDGNRVNGARDITLANSPDNRITHNTVRDSRYGVHLVFSPRTVIERNTVDSTTSGIVVLFSEAVTVRHNRVLNVRDTAGAGLAFKGSGQALVQGNDVVHCSVGAQAETPVNPWNVIRFEGNRFAHNVTGMYFFGEKGGHVVHGNRFEKNLTQVAVSSPDSAVDNDWRGNRWDDYEGFDRNGDGVGDTPHEIWAFADRIWMEEPYARFFRNAPVLELLDFLERLAPFSSPRLILRDPAPVVGGKPPKGGPAPRQIDRGDR